MPDDGLVMLLEIRAIERLKYRYMRALDTYDWDLLRLCMAEDISVWFGTGAYRFDGRDNVLTFLREVLDPGFYASHIAAHPEIELTGPCAATGVWRLQDLYVSRVGPRTRESDIKGGDKLEGAACYYDEYLKVGGTWLIKSSGDVRIFEAITRPVYGEGESLRLEPLRGVRPR